MTSEQYWRRRAIAAENHINKLCNKSLVDDILPIYSEALKNISDRVRKIFKKFALDGNLSEAEAMELLSAAESKEELDNIRKTLDDIQDPELQMKARSRVNAPAYAARISREQAAGKVIEAELTKIAGRQITQMEELLKNSYEYGKYRTIYDLAKGTGMGIDFTVMPVNAVNAALNTPWNGKNFSERVWDDTTALAEKAKEIVAAGIMSGESVGSMSVKLDDCMKKGQYNAVRLVRTEANHFYNDGRLQGYRDAGVKRYKFIAFLDLTTCKVCGRLDGQKFDVDAAQPGKNYPPMHPNDRCTTTAVVVINGKEVEGGERFSRNPETGKDEYVPETMTWSEWYKQKIEGNPVAQKNKKIWNNRSADKRQHMVYQKALGKKIPKDFEKFQAIKYNDPERWKKIKSEYRARKNENSLNNSDDVGIIREQSRKAITPINDSSISRVKNVKIQGYTDEQCSFVQQQHKELLKYSRENNDNKEVAFVFDKNMKSLGKYKGSDESLDFGKGLYGEDLFVMHNHPRNGSFSTTDIEFFAKTSNIKTLTIVKNNGNVETLTKGENFDISAFAKEYSRLYKKIVKTGIDSEKDKFVKTLLTKSKAGVIWDAGE